MGVYIWSRLPSEYQEVEYIQSSGTQYIDTLFIPNNNSKIEISMGGIDGNMKGMLFGVRSAWSTDASVGKGFLMAAGFDTGNWYGGMFGRRYSSSQDSGFNVFNFLDGGNYILALDQSGFYQNGTKKFTPNTVTFTAQGNVYLFMDHDYISGGVANEPTTYKLYYCKLWDNGTLVRDFIPCYRKSDSVIGLYDLVNNQFYTNSGSGTFSKGSDVNTYRESSLKNAYIGERPLELKQIFDFSKDTGYGDYTYYKVDTNGLTIDNANGCCRTNGTSASGMVYKSINAKACWLRILFNCTGAVDGNIQLGPYSGQNGIPTGTTVGAILEHGSYGYNRLRIYYYGENSYANYTISNNTDYYLDLYYENGLYTVSLMDASMNVLKSLTKQDTSGHNTMPYSGFAMWTGNNSYQWRVKKYREDYKI